MIKQQLLFRILMFIAAFTGVAFIPLSGVLWWLSSLVERAGGEDGMVTLPASQFLIWASVATLCCAILLTSGAVAYAKRSWAPKLLMAGCGAVVVFSVWPVVQVQAQLSPLATKALLALIWFVFATPYATLLVMLLARRGGTSASN